MIFRVVSRFLGAAAAFALLIVPPETFAMEKSLDGGAHIWAGSGWGEFRAHVGPRYAWDWFSVRPNGALGPAFFSGVDGTPASIGGYLDIDAQVPLGEHKLIQLGVGGGAGHIFGMANLTGPILPQGYAQAGYRWDVNYVGLMLIGGPKHDRPKGFPSAMPDTVNFSGIGLRFEYQIDRYEDDE